MTSAGTHTVREGYLVRVTDAEGVGGFGEAAPLAGHGGEPLDDTLPALRRLASELDKMVAAENGGLPGRPLVLRSWMRRLAAAVPGAPAARAGLDLALADLAARRSDLPLARWWHPAARPDVTVNAAIGAVAPDEAARQAGLACRDGFRTIKVKIGTNDVDDLARVAAIRDTVGPAIALRADANGAWDESGALRMLLNLAEFDLEYVEQPVPAREIAALARLRRASPVRVAADESLAIEDGLDRVLHAVAADVLVLKPMLIGGSSAAWDLAERAARWNVDVVVTAALTSAVGRMGALHLAAALPQHGARFASGLASGGLLADDMAAATPVREGLLVVPDVPGLGVEPDGTFEAVLDA